MSAQPSPDRPLLRLHAPESIDYEHMTIRGAYEEYLQPEIAQAKQTTRADYARFVGYWEQYSESLGKPTETIQLSQLTANLGQRMESPLLLSHLTSRVVLGFQNWLVGQKLSLSTADKAVKTIKRIIELAGQDGMKVNAIKVKSLKPKAAAKYYLDNEQVDRLWAAADAMQWPPERSMRRSIGSGMQPAVFWRSILIMLRTYGMRVQDLVSYEAVKTPVQWQDVSFGARTPNPEGKCDWELGWLYYRASKTDREYYLPLTRHTRAAIDRLRQCAIASHGSVDPQQPILPCPKSHGLTNNWKILLAAANVAKPNGEAYQLEDFRKTAATYLDEHAPELAYHVCGWATAGSSVAHRHYINSERKLVASLPTAPMPSSFDAWLP